MAKEKRHYTAEFKVEILREHLENQVPVGKLCEQHNLTPNLFYVWQKELFTGALSTFSKTKTPVAQNDRIVRLEEKLKYKDFLISEKVEDNLRLKKIRRGG